MKIEQELDVDDFLSDIEFSIEPVIRRPNPVRGIALNTLYQLLSNYFPQIKIHLENANTEHST